VSENETVHASDRLHADKQLVETAARRIMDSITGDWSCEGRPFIPEICSAAQAIIDATARHGHALEKAALEISSRAEGCYVDRLGEHTDATEQIRKVAESLLIVGKTLRALPQTVYATAAGLGSIGEREVSP
jgi:hypothetical protein